MRIKVGAGMPICTKNGGLAGQTAQRAGRIQAGHGIVEAKGLDISGERFPEIGDRLFFGIALPVSRDVGHAGGKSTCSESEIISTVRPLVRTL